jgi:hypothetical protein
MSPGLESLYRTLDLNGVARDELPSWVGDLAFDLVDEASLDELVTVLAKARGNANQTFWAKVRRQPRTEEAWTASMYIGGEMTEASAAHMKARDRRVVELIRSRYPTQIRMAELFHSDKDA